MCGIAGVIRRDGGRADPALLARMVALLGHRGPDGSGVHTEGPVGLGHARLSIVDPTGGHQPMATEDGRVTVTFNGEVFNHIELRKELEARGRRFRTRCDTEAILHAYLEWGDDCVKRFNGQWSFALWDRDRRRLLASRDPLGVRPFYFTRTEDAFVFGSEVKALFAHPGVRRALDPVGLGQILSTWVTLPPRTVFEGVQELAPGTSLVLEEGDVAIRPYFALDYAPDPRATPEALAEELRSRLVTAARLRFERADVPVGAYLSGGIDSSVITAVVHRFTDAPLVTFSVTFETAEHDESSFQHEVAKHLGVEHHSVLCRTEDIGRIFPRVIWHAEQPLVRTAPAPMLMLAGLVRERGYKVVLTGEGSDELLGGYDIFKEAKVRRFWARHPESRLRPLLLRKLYPWMPGMQKQSDAYLQAFFHVRPEDVASPYFSHLPRWELTRKLSIFLSPDMRARIERDDPYGDVGAELPGAFGRWDPFCQAQYLETRYLLPGYILSSQGDRMAMAHGVEGRYPFLDPSIVELASRVPPSLKMRVLDEKHLLKRAMGDLVPASVIRRPKQPYRAPEQQAFFDGQGGPARFDWVESLLSKEAIERSGVFHPPAVAKLAEKARSGKLVGQKDAMSLVAILSTQLVFAQLIERFGAL